MLIYCTDLAGKTHELEATEEWSIMEIIREGGLPILAQCGGSCACATCHVYVDPSWKTKLPEPSEEEVGMLDGAFEVTEDSRLACQVFFTKDLDGLRINGSWFCGRGMSESIFDDRQKAAEKSFGDDQKTHFRASSMAMKSIGSFVVDKIGLEGDQAKDYVNGLMDLMVVLQNQSAILDRVFADFQEHKIDISRHRLDVMFADAYEVARTKIWNTVDETKV